MSRDLRVWSVRDPDLPAALPDLDSWLREGDSLRRRGRTWQVVVTPNGRVEPEDVPAEVRAALPGVAYLTELQLEPSAAPKSAADLARKVARGLARTAHGVVEDPHEGTVTTPAGVRRFVAARRPERFALIAMRWYLADGQLDARPGRDAFVDLLERWLPEGLPRRYGEYEPPQHRLEEGGLAAFREYLAAHDDLVWYPHRPVVGVQLGFGRAGWGHAGFRCGYVAVDIEACALEQPGWPRALRELWRRASLFLRPFYGDVRTLAGFVPMGASYGSDMHTDVEPTCNGFWRGLPRDPGQACVVGPPYVDLWPGLRDGADHVDGLAFAQTEDWSRSDSVLDRLGPVPEDLAQRWTPEYERRPDGGWSVRWNTEYPSRWPFASGA